MKGKFFAIIFGVVLAVTANAQSESIDRVNFEEFQPYLQQSDDTVYVINFWATWCAPCIKEIPDFEQIHKDFSEDRVKVVLVSLDFPTMVESNLIPFIDKNNITASVILLDDPDANAWIDKVDPRWTGALPATLIYHQNERVFYNETINYETIDGVLSDLLNQ